jgi:hypothetical protein
MATSKKPNGNRPYPYFPAKPGKGKLPGTEWFVHACNRRWGFKNLGTYVLRDMRGRPGVVSVHATGAALDIGFNGAKAATVKEAWDWFMDHTRELGIVEAHWYTAPGTKYGIGYRCSRGEGEAGVIEWTATNNGGKGGAWFHIELSPEMAASEKKISEAWRALPKPT